MSIILPTQKRAPLAENPKRLIIFSKPKVGKTELVSDLPNNLILDLEEGSKFLNCMSLNITNLNELREVCGAIYEARMKGEISYDYVTIDTISRLEEWVVWEATEAYMQTTIGKNFNRFSDEDQRAGLGVRGEIKPRSLWQSVLELPNGAGYGPFRNHFLKWLNVFDKLAPHIILVAHIKDKYVQDQGKEVIANTIDLMGKLSSITASLCDAIGYIYRDHKNNQNMISFKSKAEIESGSRIERLLQEEFPISKKVDGKLITYWNKIYITSNN